MNVQLSCLLPLFIRTNKKQMLKMTMMDYLSWLYSA